jgi:hypothetical protein
MATALQRNYVRLPQLVLPPRNDTALVKALQDAYDAIHELNARIYFLQEQIAVLSAATSTPVEQLEDY